MKLIELDAALEKKVGPVRGLLGPAPSLCFPRPSNAGRHLTTLTVMEEDSLNLSEFIARVRGVRNLSVDAHLGAVED